MKTYLFYDIETTGLNKCFDQVVQFAAIRTDMQFNELERVEYYLRLNKDVIPSPRAFITHRLPPSKLSEGQNEFEAMQKIHALLNTPNTISIGYNNLGFDDEFLRFSFYRNLLSPYTHQYANGCRRMDLYPMTVMYSLFKPALLNWPPNDLKLENISTANGFSKGTAHNAMVDVIATLNLAKCLREDIVMWEYLLQFFDKETDLARCNTLPLGIMIEGKFGARQQYQCPVMPLGPHQFYKNQFCWLRLDLPTILSATPENFVDHCFVINKKIGESGWVLPLKSRFFKSYLSDCYDEVTKTYGWLQSQPDLLQKIQAYYLQYTYPKIPHIDVDAALYENGFLSSQDQRLCQQIHHTLEKLPQYATCFSQTHLQEIAIRIMGRHYPGMLSVEQHTIFQKHLEKISQEDVTESTVDYKGKRRLTPKEALDDIAVLSKESLDEEQQQILEELKLYFRNQFSLVIEKH